MKISYKTDYILKIILDLALRYNQGLVHIEEISERQDVPKKFLEQILLELKKGGFVESKKGPNGGYSLSRPPELISVGQIIRFTDGSLYPISCVDSSQKQTCADFTRCVFVPIWAHLGDITAHYLDSIHFKDLAEQAKQKIYMEANDYVI